MALSAGARGQQAPVDQNLLNAGANRYADDCALCHQADGTGQQPIFPALRGDQNLGDLGLIVSNIQNGKKLMPAFPEFSAEQIAALATYVRNSWGNSFGGASPDEVSALLAGAAQVSPAVEKVSVWSGVYTDAQADRGQPLQSGVCSRCHGLRLNGAGEVDDEPPSPAIARALFLQRWEGRSVEILFKYTRAMMPLDNPGQLTDQQYADSIAYMFQVSGIPAGDQELPPDPSALSGLVINEKAP